VAPPSAVHVLQALADIKVAAVAFSIECPTCGVVSGYFVRGVCRACYLRDHHQRRFVSSVAVIHDI
jgi:hypothetical protein